MKKSFVNHLLLLCGAAFMLVGCPGPDPGTDPTPTPNPPEPPVVTPPDDGGDDKENLRNSILFDGKTYGITAAGTEVEGAIILYFDAANDAGAYFGLYLDEGEMTLTKSQTFTFVSNPAIEEEGLTYFQGEPGTFSYGEFYTDDDYSLVTSGTIKVEVSGESYTIEVDCVCEGNKELTIRYTGELEYYGPLGTSTIQVDDTEFPYIMVFGYEPNKFDDSNLYATEMWIMGFAGLDGNIELDSELTFVHSTPTLGAGVYNAVSLFDTDPSLEDKTFIGYAGVYDYETDAEFGGGIITGKVNIAVEGDIYTMTFEDVVLGYGESGPTYDMSGTYTGVLVDEEDYSDTASASAAPKFAKSKSLRAKATRHQKTKSLIESLRRK
jgi:hypothetical protein